VTGCVPSAPPTTFCPQTPTSHGVHPFAAATVGRTSTADKEPVVHLHRYGDTDASRRDAGMSTAEYAIGTVAACGFAGLLLKLLTGGEVADLLRSVVRHAFSFAS